MPKKLFIINLINTVVLPIVILVFIILVNDEREDTMDIVAALTISLPIAVALLGLITTIITAIFTNKKSTRNVSETNTKEHKDQDEKILALSKQEALNSEQIKSKIKDIDVTSKVGKIREFVIKQEAISGNVGFDSIQALETLRINESKLKQTNNKLMNDLKILNDKNMALKNELMQKNLEITHLKETLSKNNDYDYER